MTTLVRTLRADDAEYPTGLRHLSEAPATLYVRGRLDRADALAVAIVGSRDATPYGLEMARRLAAELAERGITIVSGLARGIDAAAHRGALAAGGRTIAVLGSGIDVIYPPEHRGLAREIEAAGAVVTELAPGTRPLHYHFPMRNRIIAALSLGVVIVEAAERSGALSTASWAAQLGRDVMAVPGRVTSTTSRGAHGLIQDGAALVESAADVVAQLPPLWRAVVAPARPAAVRPVAEGDAAALLAALGDEPASIDELIDRTGLGVERAAAAVLDLELAGRVQQVAGPRYARVD
jgi:DNA processing protein